jgi:hypothetical protein
MALRTDLKPLILTHPICRVDHAKCPVSVLFPVRMAPDALQRPINGHYVAADINGNLFTHPIMEQPFP